MQTSTENNRLAQRSLFDMAVILLLIVLSLLVIWLSLTHRTHGSAHWPGYSDLLKGFPAPSAWLRWVLGDISEVAFYKHELASIGLLAGAYLAYWANRTRQRWQGFAICYGSGLWPWLVTSSLLGLLLSNLLANAISHGSGGRIRIEADAQQRTLNVLTAGDQNMVDYITDYPRQLLVTQG